MVEQSVGIGNPPQLFLSSEDGVLRSSSALADAVRREHALRPKPGYSGPADLHLKLATPGDIDGDGDIDLWVESTGGANVISHFMMNNGDGTFTLDPDRAPYELLHNPPPEFWRHVGNDLVDLDNDGDLDLALGQIRDIGPTHINQFSIVLVNDGTGHYPVRVELPQPAFADGYTSVQTLTHFDVNGDGFQDLLLPHSRNDDGPPGVIPWTGRYLQVLVNRGGTSFSDETPTWVGDQSATTPERNAAGDPLHNVGVPGMHDVERDGCVDLIVSGPEVRADSPLVYRNDGSGRFQAMSPVPFAGSDRYFGHGAVPANVNGDAAIDFVVPRHNNGPDRRYGTADDFTTLVTLLNTTPAGPIRCSLPGLTLEQSNRYRDTWQVLGQDRPSQNQGPTALTPSSGTAFTDTPVRPGATPLKAIHLLELRTRIAALRTREGLASVQWTDPVLTVGATPVKRVHLTELRAALNAAYDAAGRPRPTYTDGTVSARVTAIRAVHVVELRDAILALE